MTGRELREQMHQLPHHWSVEVSNGIRIEALSQDRARSIAAGFVHDGYIAHIRFVPDLEFFGLSPRA